MMMMMMLTGLFFSLQVIDGQILCVHGGLSPDIRTLDQVIKNGLSPRTNDYTKG